jgi:hypothetical protein
VYKKALERGEGELENSKLFACITQLALTLQLELELEMRLHLELNLTSINSN